MAVAGAGGSGLEFPIIVASPSQPPVPSPQFPAESNANAVSCALFQAVNRTRRATIFGVPSLRTVRVTRWLVPQRSTIIQVSAVHTGRTADPAAALARLLDRMVRP